MRFFHTPLLSRRPAASVFHGIQNRSRRHGDRHGEHHTEAAGQALHDGDADVVGVDNLKIWQIVGIVQKEHAQAAAGEGEDQRIAVRSHHVPAHPDARLPELLPVQRRVLGKDLAHGASDGHGHIHHRTEAGDQKAGKKQASHLDALHGPERHQRLDIRYVIARDPGRQAEQRGGNSRRQHAAHGSDGGDERFFRKAAD